MLAHTRVLGDVLNIQGDPEEAGLELFENNVIIHRRGYKRVINDQYSMLNIPG